MSRDDTFVYNGDTERYEELLERWVDCQTPYVRWALARALTESQRAKVVAEYDVQPFSEWLDWYMSPSYSDDQLEIRHRQDG